MRILSVLAILLLSGCELLNQFGESLTGRVAYVPSAVLDPATGNLVKSPIKMATITDDGLSFQGPELDLPIHLTPEAGWNVSQILMTPDAQAMIVFAFVDLPLGEQHDTFLHGVGGTEVGRQYSITAYKFQPVDQIGQFPFQTLTFQGNGPVFDISPEMTEKCGMINDALANFNNEIAGLQIGYSNANKVVWSWQAAHAFFASDGALRIPVSVPLYFQSGQQIGQQLKPTDFSHPTWQRFGFALRMLEVPVDTSANQMLPTADTAEDLIGCTPLSDDFSDVPQAPLGEFQTEPRNWKQWPHKIDIADGEFSGPRIIVRRPADGPPFEDTVLVEGLEPETDLSTEGAIVADVVYPKGGLVPAEP